MIHFELIQEDNVDALKATSPGGNMYVNLSTLTPEQRMEQARRLIDVAAAMIEGNEGLADAFELLHEAMDSLPAAAES